MSFEFVLEDLRGGRRLTDEEAVNLTLHAEHGDWPIVEKGVIVGWIIDGEVYRSDVEAVNDD
jgi:hypothetical protein